jgi:hypothetical protein
MGKRLLFTSVAALCFAGLSPAADEPYFTTYTSAPVEPGSLGLALNQAAGSPSHDHGIIGSYIEAEYGLRKWWTAEVWLAGEDTPHEGAAFTGYHIVNRFRPFEGEHWINPALLVEYGSSNAADRSYRSVVGHEGVEEALLPLEEARREHRHAVEARLVLSSKAHGWDITENVIAAKSIDGLPWAFGYTFGVSHPLAAEHDGADRCTFCRVRLHAGAEVFGGLGTRYEFGFHETSHYVAPALAWSLPSGLTLKVSPAIGLNGNSHDYLLRFGVSYELERFGRLLHATAGD